MGITDKISAAERVCEGAAWQSQGLLLPAVDSAMHRLLMLGWGLVWLVFLKEGAMYHPHLGSSECFKVRLAEISQV